MSIKYLAGRTFDVGEDTVEPGDELTAAQVKSIPWLEAFVSAGYIYAVTPDKGYDQLPPHVFNAVQTKAEAVAAIEAGKAGTTITEVSTAGQAAVDDDEQTKLAAKQQENDEEFAAHRNSIAAAVPTKEEKEDAVNADDLPTGTDPEVVQGEPTPPPNTEEIDSFDPGDHTVDEVKAYVEEHPDRKDDVLAAEKDGKARKGVLEL